MRKIERIRHEARRRAVEVLRVEQIGANFVSVVFGGDDLEGFTSLGFDDHCKFIFDTGSDEPEKRDYTPRYFDATERELTIEFFRHEGGAASDWADSAVPGCRATIGGPKSSMMIPADYAWHLLAGDETALPAIHRRLEELPAGVCVIALIQAANPADQRELPSRAALDLRWLSGEEDIADAIRSLELPEGEGFAWCAGEASVMARARAVLLDEKGHPLEHMRVASYWRIDGAVSE